MSVRGARAWRPALRDVDPRAAAALSVERMPAAPLRIALRGLAIALLATATLTVACGRKTPVRPPEFVAPATIADLEAANVTAGVALAWRRPRQTADAKPLFDLDAFVVERALPGLPFAFLTRVQVPDRDRLRQLKRFTFVDTTTLLGEAYRYRVKSVTEDGYFSAPSNVVDIVRAIPTITPTAAATAAPTPTPTP